MAITLAPHEIEDVALTDDIGRGEVSAAARLWVRYWPTALDTAREYVDPVEVPGLAAEALIGTIAAIAIGRGPREDLAGFVTAAVRELGESDEPAPEQSPDQPAVFKSPMLTTAFTELDEPTQQTLRDFAAAGDTGDLDEETLRALTGLQNYYLAEHAARTDSADCRRAHIALMSVAEGTMKTLSGGTWVHLSECAWCTEAFHEIAFSNTELGALIDPAVLGQVPVTPSPAVEPAVEPVAAVVPLALAETVAAPEPVAATADAAAEDTTETQTAPVVVAGAAPLAKAGTAGRGHRRGKPARLVAILAAAAVAAAVVTVAVLANGGDSPTPTATAPETNTSSPTPDFGALAGDTPTAPLPSPTTSATAPATGASTFAPVFGVTDAPVTAPSPNTSSAASPTKTPKPTQKPTSKPKPTKTSDPDPSTPPPSTHTPTPTPSATPTKSCNALQHLLGIC